VWEMKWEKNWMRMIRILPQMSKCDGGVGEFSSLFFFCVFDVSFVFLRKCVVYWRSEWKVSWISEEMWTFEKRFHLQIRERFYMRGRCRICGLRFPFLSISLP